ncbi:hypothetical protein [Cetobacterium sp.]|uniref:hypothetical protein n=1 Tax=Cetobacterium sp. TaxID=2071632 RepID=UPI003F2A7A97
MNLKEKFYDRLGFKRESTVNSMKSNPELKAGNIVKVAETGYFYDIKSTSTSIPLNNGLFAEVKQTTFLQIVTKCVSDLTNLTSAFNSLKNSFETLKKAFETHETKKATQSQDGHMSKEDKKKLDGVGELVTQSKDGYMRKEDKTKLDGIAEKANNYSHPTGAGNNHIPSGGKVGQALINSGNGIASWEDQLPSIKEWGLLWSGSAIQGTVIKHGDVTRYTDLCFCVNFRGREFIVTVPVQAWLSVGSTTLLNRGGQNADRDYDGWIHKASNDSSVCYCNGSNIYLKRIYAR